MTALSLPPITRSYVSIDGASVSAGLVHYRVCGDGPSVVLLHDSPRSSRLHIPLMRALSSRFRVFALDTPGYGNSDPLGIASPSIPDFAAVLGSALEQLGLARAPIYATHTSAKIALALAVRGGTMPLLVLDGLAIPIAMASEAFIDAYMRAFQPEPTGAWLAAEWTRTRDMLRWFPWFQAGASNRMKADAPSAEWLEDYGIDLFSAGPHYADAYAAAMRWNPTDDLQTVGIPTIIGARSDDVLYTHLDRVPCRANAQLSVQRLDTDREQWLTWIADSLGRAVNDTPAALAMTSEGAERGYLSLAHGQLHWQRYFSQATASGRPLLILSGPSTLEAHAMAREMVAHRDVIVPDLPGFGDSDVMANCDIDAIADALAALIGRLEPEACDVLAIGLAAPLGAAMAASRPGFVARLAVIGASAFGTAADEALLPEIAFDPLAGSHLHRFWHMLRDSTVQWPWHDASPAAIRPWGTLPDSGDLHQALTGMLKQRTNYAATVAAGLAAHNPDLWRSVRVPTLVATGGDPAMANAEELIGLLPKGRAFAASSGDYQEVAKALHEALALLETI